MATGWLQRSDWWVVVACCSRVCHLAACSRSRSAFSISCLLFCSISMFLLSSSSRSRSWQAASRTVSIAPHTLPRPTCWHTPHGDTVRTHAQCTPHTRHHTRQDDSRLTITTPDTMTCKSQKRWHVMAWQHHKMHSAPSHPSTKLYSKQWGYNDKCRSVSCHQVS